MIFGADFPKIRARQSPCSALSETFPVSALILSVEEMKRTILLLIKFVSECNDNVISRPRSQLQGSQGAICIELLNDERFEHHGWSLSSRHFYSPYPNT
jgi:hypothetical protein